MNKYLRHLLLSSIFDIFLLTATATSVGYIIYQILSFHLLIIFVIGIVSLFFVSYKLYSVYYIEYPRHVLTVKHEIYEINSDITMLMINNYFIKDKKLNKIIKQEIKNKKRFIKELNSGFY